MKSVPTKKVFNAPQTKPAPHAVRQVLKAVRKKKISLSEIINYSIVTSEYQTALEVAKVLYKALPTSMHPIIDVRLTELEQASRNELTLAFNIKTEVGQLATTPVYPIRKEDLLFQLYLIGADSYDVDTTNFGIRDIAQSRKQSGVLYLANAPIFRVNEFLNHEGYQDILNDKDTWSDRDVLRIHETLLFVATLKSSEYHERLATEGALYNKDVLDALVSGGQPVIE